VSYSREEVKAITDKVLNMAKADAVEVPTHLTTAKPDNLPYYASFGFAITGEVSLPRGAPLWYMLRPARTGATAP